MSSSVRSPASVIMYRALKLTIYGLSKLLGLFHLSRFLTRDHLRILCYHGFSAGDEADFRPLLFISPGTFERRLVWLRKKGFPVLRWQEAMRRLDEGSLPHGATVLTIDDGLSSVYRWAYPLLQKHRLPALLYLTTYYFSKQTPVFRLIVSYLFWKSPKQTVRLDGLGVPGFERAREVELTAATRVEFSHEFADFGDTQCDNDERTRLSEALAERLGVDYGKLLEDRIFSLVSADELKDMLAGVLDVELHTHRHDFPLDPEAAKREIQDNRAVIEPFVSGPLRHFCYPSGLWSEQHWPILRELGIETATTIAPGLVRSDSPRLALDRILDSEEVSQLEFEAEVYGFSELIRRLRRRLAGATRSLPGEIEPRRQEA